MRLHPLFLPHAGVKSDASGKPHPDILALAPLNGSILSYGEGSFSPVSS